MKRITILLAEDHMIVREGLVALLNYERDLEVVGQAGNGREAVELSRKLAPAVIVMDIAMPLLNGLEAAGQILRNVPSPKVLFLSAHCDDADLYHAMEIGAAGYLVKQTAADVLPKAIREICKGNTFFSPSVSKRLDDQRWSGSNKAGSTAKRGLIRLSPREMEVLQLIAEGMANKHTADELQISVKTVEKHRGSLMKKLKIHDTAGLTRHAIASGIIECSVQATII